MTPDDMYGLEALFCMTIPDPEGSGELVPMFSWEFLAALSVFVAMSPWFSWRVSPGTQQRLLVMGDPRLADQWYETKLRFYRSYTRAQVAKALKSLLVRFYNDCPVAWTEVLALRGGAQPAAATNADANAGAPPGAPPRPEPLDEPPPV